MIGPQLILTTDLEVMRHEHLGNMSSNLDSCSGHLPAGGSLRPLTGAVVDKRRNPFIMLGQNGTPEELLVGPGAAVPLVRESLSYPREADSVWPDLLHRQLRPDGNVYAIWNLLGRLHGLHALKTLLEEAEGAVTLLGQSHELKNRLVRGRHHLPTCPLGSCRAASWSGSGC